MIMAVRQAESFLRAQHVAVDVVADVEDLVAGDAEQPLEVVQVAALVDPAALELPLAAVRLSPSRSISGAASRRTTASCAATMTASK